METTTPQNQIDPAEDGADPGIKEEKHHQDSTEDRAGLVQFTTWLLTQDQRDDPVGDLARDVAVDPDFPDGATIAEIRQYLDWRSDGWSAVLEALDNAWAEFQEVAR